MHADLSRITFYPERGYSAVVAQQGRVQLDADSNEQTLTQLYQHRVALTDLIGHHGGPADAAGFKIESRPGRNGLPDLSIGAGRYYVAGILCDAHRPDPGVPVPFDGEPPLPAPDIPGTWTYWDQPDAFRDPALPADRLPAELPYLVYLKVWERVVTAAEDPDLREVALGTDTSARIKAVWQVLALPNSALRVRNADAPPGAIQAAFDEWAEQHTTPARLAARAQRPDGADDPCVLRPDARYRGPENQLYRVEIHTGGSAAEASFTWSRENGSVVFAVDDLDGTWVSLASLGGDTKLDLDVGDVVEFTDTACISRQEPQPLLRVEELDLPERRVRLSEEPAIGHRPDLHPFLRRWDQRASHGPGTPESRGGALALTEGRWIPLEDGVEVFFDPTEPDGPGYRSGDYWVIPARTATGDVQWPTDPAGRPLLRPPLGVTAYYAPLAWVTGPQKIVDLRLTFGMNEPPEPTPPPPLPAPQPPEPQPPQQPPAHNQQ